MSKRLTLLERTTDMEPLVYWDEEEEVLDIEPGWELANSTVKGAVRADILGGDGPTGDHVWVVQNA